MGSTRFPSLSDQPNAEVLGVSGFAGDGGVNDLAIGFRKTILSTPKLSAI